MISSVEDLPDALFLRGTIDIMALHQVTPQADVLREAALAKIADKIPTAAALVFQVLREAVPDFVPSAALRALQREILVPQVIRVPRLAVRDLMKGQPDET